MVSRNASLEVIRAAYRTLSQKYHPDKNPDARDASVIMTNINESYEVLSNREKRKKYDEWIVQQENMNFT
jgi:DnaJ-class molecular chaperone